MKADIHPNNYRQVIFLDSTSGKKSLVGSTVQTKETGTFDDGKEYPQVTIEISSASHPVYTGKEVTIDTARRVDKFKRRAAAAVEKQGKK